MALILLSIAFLPSSASAVVIAVRGTPQKPGCISSIIVSSRSAQSAFHAS